MAILLLDTLNISIAYLFRVPDNTPVRPPPFLGLGDVRGKLETIWRGLYKNV
jgi:hypothetical protein